ncbi:hypothetical protein BWC54_004440 [Salmonella enterica subsp. enterica serovar Oslo]|nr:hypothetical protein [Salmonella enterica]ECF3780019.1 hypothetical protein [Salmonella enterica subsp. enterica serovar Oslo]EGZ4376761.1 hypothetical protein [Salmonella enterica subsp. enterica serovar Lexington]ECG6797789.1 hypothetical protein [Salmonella enterica subsp. enterica serovar Oslo]EDT9558281.1 hypothetical protein [Salmonella enterica subsp. enterica serovar Oslo]
MKKHCHPTLTNYPVKTKNTTELCRLYNPYLSECTEKHNEAQDFYLHYVSGVRDDIVRIKYDGHNPDAYTKITA